MAGPHPSLLNNQRCDALTLLFVIIWYYCLLMTTSSEAVMNNFINCSLCFCVDLPKVSSLDGRVVDVHDSSTGGADDWFSLNESIVSNETATLFLRSIDPVCKVEIKFKFINSDADIIMYTGGRVDPTATVFGMRLVNSPCRDGSWPSPFVLLGTSVISTREELAIASLPRNKAVVDFQLMYRQHCQGTRDQVGFRLPPPSVNGSTQTVQLVNPYGISVFGTFGTFITWTITPLTLNCATEITFSKSTNNTIVSLNGLNPVLLGITHKVPGGMELIIQMMKRDSSGETLDAAVHVEYRAVDCGSASFNGTAIQISSWNNVVRPLYRVDVPVGHGPWQEINFSFPDDGTQHIAVWYLAGPEPAYTGFTSWTGAAWTDDIYRNDFNHRFISKILPGTMPFTFLSVAGTAVSTSFMYAFLPLDAPPMLVATARNSTYQVLAITQDMIAARKIYIMAANFSCSVEIKPASLDSVPGIQVLPYGFRGTGPNDILDNAFVDDDYSGFNDTAGIGLALRPRPIRSIGPEIGVQFLRWIEDVRAGLILYRMVCPMLLNTAATTNVWQYVSDSSDYSYLVPPPLPKKESQQCWVDISGISSSGRMPRDIPLLLLVTCLQAPMRTKLLRDRQVIIGGDFNCTGALKVDAYRASSIAHRYRIPPNSTLFAYRVRCGKNHQVDLKRNALAPLVPLDKKFVADSEWKTLDTSEYEYERDNNHYSNHRQVWMLQAKNANCRVDVHFDQIADLSWVSIVEDYMDHFQPLMNFLVADVSFKNIRYLSCGPRLFIVGLYEAAGKKTRYQYRQVCGSERAPTLQCSQDVTVREPSLLQSDWQSLQASSPGNLNQLQQLRYHIPFPDHLGNNLSANGTNKVLELEFTSLVAAESWTGASDDYRSITFSSETHGVWLNDKYRAIVGKQYLFKTSVSIRLDSLLRTKTGDHLFTVRYRMVDVREARREIRLGEVLIASSKAKTLEFKIPQQFSSHQLHEIIKKKRFEYEYEDHYRSHPEGDFPIWFFRHQYSIRPSKAKCQVVLKFKKIDIGSGHLLGNLRVYNNEQHRLSVMLNSNGTRRIPLNCADEAQSETTSVSKPLCVRMDRTYISAPGSAVALLFRSTDVGEYEYDEEGLAVNGFTGPEVTFGSGWTATYEQVCDSAKVEALVPIPLPLVTAKPVAHSHDWHRNLPGQLKSDKYRLFRDRRWMITPQQVGCAVQYLVETKKKSSEPLPVLFLFGTTVTVPRVNKTFTSANVTVIQLGTSKVNQIVINYRQVCTSGPTASPTTPSPTVIIHSKVDGETCTADVECASGICSKVLQRCTTKACSAQCASKSSNQALCQAFVVVGCSCQWSAQSGSCVMIG